MLALRFRCDLARSHVRIVVTDGEEVEVFGLEHLILLCVNEHDSPQVRDEPRVDRLVASVRRH